MHRPASALLLTLALLPAPASTQVARRSERYFESDGARIHYVVQGTGAPVVLLHGFALSAEMNWIGPGIADSLARQFTVIAVDLRGHGGSTKFHDPAAYGTALITDVVRLLDHLRIERAHVVGYSLGSRIALSFAIAHPDRVLRAVLGGQGWQPPGSPLPPHVRGWLEQLDRAARESTSVADVFERPGGSPLRPELRAGLARNDARALAAVLRSAGPLAVPEAELAAGRVPTLAVYGENDAGARADVEALRAVRPDVTVAVIPGVDHATAMRHPGLAAAIRAFLATR